MSTSQTAPQTLEAALERINELEEQLALAHRLFHQHSVGNQNLSDHLSSLNRGSPSPPYRSISQQSSSSSESSSESTTENLPLPGPPGTRPTTTMEHASSKQKMKAAPPVDIGAFVLRALSLRKDLTVGNIDPLEAEAEFERIVGGSGLDKKQTAQVREWAGLA
ncbi:hypothetical protein JCM16303_004310 [Sporobolomyces ruberrimus]